MNKIVLSIIASIGIFLGTNMVTPFPYGLILGIGIPVVIIWYVIKKTKRDKILDTFLLGKSHYLKMLPTERKIQCAILAIFVFSFASSILYPFVNELLGLPTFYEISYYGNSAYSGTYAYGNDKDIPTFLNGILYRFGLQLLFIGFPIYLVPPALLTIPRAIFWIGAVISIFLVVKYSAGLSNRRRLAYTYLVAVQVASMWAPFFIWHPAYDSTIIPGI